MSQHLELLSGPLHDVKLADVLDRLVDDAYRGLCDVLKGLSQDATDADRKKKLVAFLHATRQRLLRLLVLVQWAHKARAVSEVSRVLATAATHSTALRDAADNLAYLHAELEATSAAHYDVATAMHVLSTAIREATGVAAPHTDAAGAVHRLDHAIHRELVRMPPPPALCLRSVAGGCCTLMAPVQCYRAVLTLAPAPDLSMPLQLLRGMASRQLDEGTDSKMDGSADGGDMGHWRWQLVHLDITAGTPLTPHQQHQLVDQVNIRMAASADAAVFAPLAPPLETADAPSTPIASAKAATPFAVPAGSGVSTQTTMPPAPIVDPATDARVAAPPLTLMHDVISNVATRLALLRCHAESQVLADGGWRGGLRVGERGGLALSQRVGFWVDALPLTGHAGEAVTPPAIDLGQTDDGCALLATHVPPLTNPLTDTLFVLETPTCDVRMLQLLTAAATHHAYVQLAALQHELTSQPELQALECHATVHDPAPTFPASPKEGPRAPPCLHINLCPGDASQAPQLLLQVQLDLHSAELQWVVGEVVRTLVAPHELAKFTDKAAQQRKETATAGTAGVAQQRAVLRATLVANEVASFVSTMHARLTLQRRRSQLQHLGVSVTTIPSALTSAYFASLKQAPAFSLTHSIALALPEGPAPWGFARVPLPLPGSTLPSQHPPTTLGGRPGCWCGRVQYWLVLDCAGRQAGGEGALGAPRWLAALACDSLGVPLRLLQVAKWQGDADISAALQRAQRVVPLQTLRRQLQALGAPWQECLLAPATPSSAALPARRFLLSAYTGMPGGRPLQAWLDVDAGRGATQGGSEGRFWLRVRCAALQGTRGPEAAAWPAGNVLEQASCGPGDPSSDGDASCSADGHWAVLTGHGEDTMLSVPYCINRGDSVLTALRDLHAVLKTQLLVARLSSVLADATGPPAGGDPVALTQVGPWDAVLRVGGSLSLRVGWRGAAPQVGPCGRAALMQQAGVSCVLSPAGETALPPAVCAQWARLVDGCQERLLTEVLSLCASGMAAVEGVVSAVPSARWLPGTGLFSARVLRQRVGKVCCGISHRMCGCQLGTMPQAPVTLHVSMFAGGKTCVTAEGDAEMWRALPAQVGGVPSSVPESVWVPTAQLHNVLLL